MRHLTVPAVIRIHHELAVTYLRKLPAEEQEAGHQVATAYHKMALVGITRTA